MDEATRKALEELKATADRFCATVDRCIAQEQADLDTIHALCSNHRDEVVKVQLALYEVEEAANAR